MTAIGSRPVLMGSTRSAALAMLAVGALCAAPLPAQESRDWKKEPWYDPALYPDAPPIREGTWSQKPLQGRLLRVKRPPVRPIGPESRVRQTRRRKVTLMRGVRTFR